MKLLVFDTETGGFDPLQQSILSLGAVVWDNGKITDEIELLIVEDQITADPEALAANKINLDEHRKRGLPPAEAMKRFQAFLTKNFRGDNAKEKVRLVGHNVYFDIGFLQRLCRLTATDYESLFSHRVLDTASILRFLSLAKKIPLADAGLDAALSYFHVDVDPARRHTALVDAKATAQLLDKLVEILHPHFAVTHGGKTAVIIIHGIGEQRPMGTVGHFTRLFAGKFVRSKPDSESKLFDLRRLSTLSEDPSNPYDPPAADKAKTKIPGYPPDTVFYEFYWAFHYRDTKPALVIRWALIVLRKLFGTGQIWHLGRKVASVGVAYLLVTFVFVLSIFLLALGVAQLRAPDQSVFWGALSLIGSVIVPWLFSAFKPFLLGWAGDAARYFGQSPDNPIERQQIREEGIELLRRLHAPNKHGSREYDNVVVVGHSLGSVIAYDIVMNYWNEVNRDLEIHDGDAPLKQALTDIEALANPHPPADGSSWHVPSSVPTAEEYQRLQTSFVKALRASSQTNQKGGNVKDAWRVRDLVTIGSPLTYARFLVADSGRELEYRQRQRELPTCPPTKDPYKDERGLNSFVFRFSHIMSNDCVVPDQTAPFLPTRWTNLHFPQDPVGGPLRPIFGWGIRDVRVHMSARSSDGSPRGLGYWLTWLLDHLLGGAHVRYWDLVNHDPKNPVSADCAAWLRAIVGDKDWPASPPVA